ncbi:Transcription accessory protein (S1 RNA-binding domain) [Marinilactibacillus psychrotolerans 42ea]|uniref:Transcription accessory protein (S1 RNA-binding domain) n=1 Tax=Marinilactibacillus psychrotolerans 42ea TaxID=1255609 RepID=A0A1R4KK33_9LACT|nr:Tex family protein [Marinilactibacillus psychrotolerans]SJN44585.1 Transcription accessory protein (S1 RNA-binding domain) [Marinilactibacillus psychrotolerans 42ea]
MAEIESKQILELLTKELTNYSKKQITSVLDLLNDGNTVPFIARYRKEVTGTLDEVQIREIEERNAYLKNLEKRKADVLASIEEQGKLTPELDKEIRQAVQMQRVEDLYRPYKQKRRTKATIAKEQGLEPFAEWILTFPETEVRIEAEKYLDEDKDLETIESVINGAHEIIAEYISDNPKYREWIRNYTSKNGMIFVKEKDSAADEKSVFEMYYDYSESIKSLVSHRILAMNRGEKEGILSVTIDIDEERIHHYMYKQEISVNDMTPAVKLIQEAINDAYKRFIGPSIEREIRNELTEKAEEQAIQVFGENLRNLLLQAPLKDQTILGLDPAYRTGCKIAVIDATGKVLSIDVIYPHKPASQQKRNEAAKRFKELVEEFDVDTVAIGNGTASRESETFVAENLKEISKAVAFVIVNEAGASVYSASEEARREFPDLQVEERSAVSIARRLQDPLAELVKIDPKSIGIGQYQHDVSQKRLTEQLDFVIETVVNQVGVNVNTASAALLKHIAGLTKTTAENVVNYREENGKFTSRAQLKKVKRLGPKAFEQAVGFLRIPDGKEPFDNTGIHPETYKESKLILEMAGVSKSEIGSEELDMRFKLINEENVLKETGLGIETYKDIVKALVAPGRDMRDDMPAPLLRTDVLTMEDLKEGMELEGTVRNVVDFGAFVDIGVKQDGLVHISKLSNKYIKHPSAVVAVGDIVKVWIDSVDLKKGRIALTMLENK